MKGCDEWTDGSRMPETTPIPFQLLVSEDIKATRPAGSSAASATWFV